MQQKGSLIQYLAVCFLIVWTISPPLGIDMIYRLAAVGCVGVWFVIALYRRYYVEQIHLYAAIFMVMVIGVAYLEHGNLDGILGQIALYILVICFFMNVFYADDKWGELKWILLIVLALLSVFNHRTAEILIEDPSIARRIVRADAEMFQYMRQGIGGYGLIYPQVCIFPALLAWVKSSFKNNKFCFAVGCIWLISFIQCVVNSGYSIAIFVTVLGAIMVLFYKRENVTGAVVMSLAVFLGTMLMVIYVDSFREALLQFFDGTEVVNKINDLVSTSQTGETEDSIYYRILAYQTSFEVLFEYPIFGSLWHRGGGGHSAILDTFAKYGVFGGYIFTKIILYVPSRYKKMYKNKKIYQISNAVVVSTLYVGFLNSFPFNFMAMLLLVLPLVFEDIIKWEGIQQ